MCYLQNYSERGARGRHVHVHTIQSKEQTVVTVNCYAALETDCNTPRNENIMKTVCENKPTAINNEQKEKMKYN